MNGYNPYAMQQYQAQLAQQQAQAQLAQQHAAYVGACGGGGYVGQPAGMMVPGGWGPCGPAAFDALTFQRSATAGAIGKLAPVTLIGLGDDCPPLLPPVASYVDSTGATIAAVEGDICEACCSPQGCFCVTKITIPDCGPCIFLLTSIKSGRCELLECGSVMADSFYCNCDPPPIKTSMLQPGLEFCITAQNDATIRPATGATVAAVDALRAASAVRFRATLYGISTDEPCRPCLY